MGSLRDDWWCPVCQCTDGSIPRPVWDLCRRSDVTSGSGSHVQVSPDACRSVPGSKSTSELRVYGTPRPVPETRTCHPLTRDGTVSPQDVHVHATTVFQGSER